MAQLFVKLALFGWIPVIVMLFTVLRPRHAIIVAYLGAWLFLPMDEIKFKGIPDLNKVTAASFGVAFGVALFDFKRLRTFRPRWYDIPMLIWCATPWVTSMKNNLGAWDAMSSVVQQLVVWGIPYFIGRVYFNDWEGFRELAIGIFVGGIIYIPFCWLEMWISPQLHKMVYGRHQSGFHMTMRWGGYRPMVFMQSGLALSFWMVVCTLSGLWLWTSGAVKKLLNVPMALLVPALFATTICCKSAGALVFMVAALGSLFWIKWFRNALPLLLLVAFPPVYMYQRINQNWSGEWLVQMVSTYMSPDRAQSLQTRFDAENLLTEKALEAPSPAFGWGKWSPDSPQAAPWRVGMFKYNGTWKDLAPTDGLWVITLGQFGIVGLVALTTTILLPCLIFWMRVPLRFWDHPLAACASPLAILLAIHMSDHLLNAMINPIFMIALGGISAISPSIRKMYKAQKLAAAQTAAYGAGYGYTAGATYPVGYTGFPAALAPTPTVRAAGAAWRA
jgi:hypothetical protein